MKYFNAVWCFALAAFGLYGGATAKVFYPGRLGAKSNGKPIPTWLGRLWCFGFAAGMLYLGFKALPLVRTTAKVRPVLCFRLAPNCCKAHGEFGFPAAEIIR